MACWMPQGPPWQADLWEQPPKQQLWFIEHVHHVPEIVRTAFPAHNLIDSSRQPYEAGLVPILQKRKFLFCVGKNFIRTQCALSWLSKGYFPVLYMQSNPESKTGHGLGVIAYREPSPSPHIEGTENNARGNTAKIWDSDSKHRTCPPFPVWMWEKFQGHMTLSEALAVQKSGLVAKIGLTLKEIRSFWQSQSAFGTAAPRPWEWRSCVVNDPFLSHFKTVC